MPYVIVKDIKDSIGWQYTGAARLIAPKEDATKGEEAFIDFVVDIPDPDEAAKKALLYDTLEEAEHRVNSWGGYILQLDEELRPVARMARIMKPTRYPTKVLTAEEYQAQEAKRQADKELPASTRWRTEPIEGWPESLKRDWRGFKPL